MRQVRRVEKLSTKIIIVDFLSMVGTGFAYYFELKIFVSKYDSLK